MSKKLFTFIIVIILAVIGFVAWKIFNAPATAPVDTNTESGTNNLFPFGQGAVNSTQTQPATTNNNESPTETVIDISSPTNIPKLRRLSTNPSVGGAFIQTSSTTESVRFVDRATGHIIESALDSTTQTKVSNVTIPQIREVLWDARGTNLIYRYLKDDSTLQSFYASIKTNAASSSQPIDGIFLPASIQSIAMAQGKITYFDPSVSSGSLIFANADGSKKSIIWSSSFSDWNVSANGSAKAFVYTRASGTATGVGYIIDTARGTATKVAGDVVGLEGNISPSGDYVFLSASQGSGLASASYSVAKKATTNLTIATLASKCVWSNANTKIIYCAVPAGVTSATYPDDWYKGAVSFADRLWKINMETGETEVILDPFVETSMNYDMTNLSVSAKDEYISFVNKNDLTIWLLRVK